MPSDKTKKLLEGLGKITASKSNPVPIPNTRVFLPETNKFWKSQLTDGIHQWPKQYHKGPWNKVVDEDGTVDYWAPFDRVYGGLAANSQTLVQKDGTEYQGKLHPKRRLIKHKNMLGEENNFYSQCLVTADGRWFDNGGFPIEAPTKLEPEKEKSAEDIQEEKRLRAEKESRILANLK